MFHLTKLGREALADRSRDPANPDGYLSHLRLIANVPLVTHSYITEALRTFNARCFKATAVMVGAAAESVILDVRESLINKMNLAKAPVSKELTDWRVKRVLEGIEAVIIRRKTDVPKGIFESFEANWSAFVHQIRTARNEAGHPVSIEPVTPEDVHASLLIFPQLAALASAIKNWVDESY